MDRQEPLHVPRCDYLEHHRPAPGTNRQLNFSISTEDGVSTKRHKAHAMLGQLQEDGGDDGGEGGGTEGWEEVCPVAPSV